MDDIKSSIQCILPKYEALKEFLKQNRIPMKIALFFSTLLLTFNLFGQNICTTNSATDHPPGCLPCGVEMRLPDGSSPLFDIVGYDNELFTPDTISYDFPCGTIEKSAWFTYFADESGAIAFSFYLNLCVDSFNADYKSDIDIGIYDDELNLITCTIVDSFFHYNGLEPNQKIRILMDGPKDKHCFIFLQFQLPKLARTDTLVSLVNSKSNSDAFCINDEICFSADTDIFLAEYNWKAPSNGQIISGGGSNDKEMCVKFNALGIDSIGVMVSNPCRHETQVFQTFEVLEFNAPIGNLNTNADSILCLGSELCFDFQATNPSTEFIWEVSPEFLIKSGGGTSDSNLCVKLINYRNGTAQVGVRPLDGCNQSILRFITLPPVPNTLLPSIKACGEHFPIELYGETFNHSGSFSIIRTNRYGCDSILRLEISLDAPEQGIYQDTICPETQCIQIGDSCYSTTRRVISIERPYPLCDSSVVFVLNYDEILDINCTQNGDRLVFDWANLEFADRYAIDINGKLDTTFNNQYTINQLSSDSTIQITVQPIGSCEYREQVSATCNFDVVGNQERYVDSKIKVMPNPSDNLIRIETELTIETIEVFDLSGRMLEQSKALSFGLKKYGLGVYFFKIKTDEGVGVKRVIIQ